MIIGKAHKESELGLLFAFLFFVSACTVLGMVLGIYVPILWLKILLVTIMATLLLLTFYIPYYVYKQRKQSDDVLKYDELNEEFIINYHNKTISISKNDILAITNHNWDIDSTSFFLFDRQDYGKIKFYLRNGKSYKTPAMDDIYDIYFKTDEIIYGLSDDENQNEENRPKDRTIEFLNSVSGWGAKKEYPAILSLIVAIILPFIGIIFVDNQAKYKEIKYGKSTGLTVIALIISAIWWLIAIIVFALVF